MFAFASNADLEAVLQVLCNSCQRIWKNFQDYLMNDNPKFLQGSGRGLTTYSLLHSHKEVQELKSAKREVCSMASKLPLRRSNGLSPFLKETSVSATFPYNVTIFSGIPLCRILHFLFNFVTRFAGISFQRVHTILYIFFFSN